MHSPTDFDTILILDFGGQYSQLIARRVRELHVYSEIISYKTPAEEIKKRNPKGLIFSGGPCSVYAGNAPHCDPEVFELTVPILGICYGMQLMAHRLGGEVSRAESREYGKTPLTITAESQLLTGLPRESVVWMSHGDLLTKPPAGFAVTGQTPHTPIAAMENKSKKLYGVQFHPEVVHTAYGKQLLTNFVYNICGCQPTWTMGSFAEQAVEEIRRTVGDKTAICALSGGVDSSVAATLVHRAIGDRLTCIFVDHGLLRQGEAEQVVETFKNRLGMKLIHVNAKERFLGRLTGVTDPEQKRKIIGEEFIRVFEGEAEKLKGADFLVQGTLYPDVIESGTETAAVIKSHHNVGGLPEDIIFTLLEPLRNLFKDEVRALGTELGLPEEIVWRQPFPGPGLAIRVLGEITAEKLEILRRADAIAREEIFNWDKEKTVWQYFAVLPDIKSVGVMGDERTYGYPIILRAVTSQDGMTADWARLPYELLEKISSRIINEVKGVNRVVYDITSKPPATIEWE